MFVGGLLTLYAETSLHAGAGAALGVVDLPVQRERHTMFPTVPGTALKGVLRDTARRRVQGASLREANKSDEVVALFGGAAGERDPEAGALAITDARLLAFPVRSMRGVFAWITCPAILDRLRRDTRLVGIGGNDLGPAIDAIKAPSTGRALVPPNSPLIVRQGKETRIVLEEYDYLSEENQQVAALARALATHLLPAGDAFKRTRERFQAALAVLSDDDLTYFVRHATEVVARIGLDVETKTVKTDAMGRGGALFYQELVPSESIFYSVALAHHGRGRRDKSAREMWEYFAHRVLPDGTVIQIGGDETVGRGLCATRLVGGAA